MLVTLMEYGFVALAVAIAMIYLCRYLSWQLRRGGCTGGRSSSCGCCAAAKDCGHSNIKEA